MAKRVEHSWNGEVRDGKLYGVLTIVHGTLSTTADGVLAKDLAWKCEFNGTSLKEILEDEAGDNISVRMARVRDLPEKHEKIAQLRGATVAYEDINSWTSKGTKGRKKIEDMTAEELLAKLTPEQIAAIIAAKG